MKRIRKIYREEEHKMYRSDMIERAYDLGFAYERDFSGCAQSAIAAIQDALGIRNDYIFKSASGLAVGIGKLGDGPCGGYSGGAIVISMFIGRVRERFDNDVENRRMSYKLVKELHDRYMQKYGSVICSDVQKSVFGRSYNLWDGEEFKNFEKDGAHIDKCTSVVGNASAWTVEIILDFIERMNVSVKDFSFMKSVVELGKFM